MKKITLKGILSMALMTTALVSFGQEIEQKPALLNSTAPEHRTCGIEKHNEEMLKNPKYAASFYERQAKFQQKLTEIHHKKMNGTYQKRAILYIPVAVHFPEANETDRVCLEAYAQTQIDVINADYTATNTDLSNWASASTYYPGLNPGSVDVKFCIATTNHPAGVDPQVTDGNPLVTIGTNGSSFGAWPEADATYSGYMNFIIKNTGSGNLGYSPLGGSIAAGNAVVMNTICYGTGAGCTGITPQAPYNLGRTVTHELGHFYNLDHTFIVDGGTNCGPADGDGIADTPKVAGSTYGSPVNGSVDGCVAGEKSLTMNYMDYVNDASMYMFTPDQATIVEAYFASVSGDWRPNAISCDTSTPTISFSSIAQAVTEGSACSYTDLTVTLRISEAATANADVTITTSGTCTAATDFEIIGGNITFPMGSTADQTATIRVHNDSFVESDETIILGMNLNANSGNATLSAGAGNQQTITVIEDDVVSSSSTTTTLLTEDGTNSSNWTTIDSDGDGNNWGPLNGAGGLNWFGIDDPCLFSASDLTIVSGIGTTTPDNYYISTDVTFPVNATSIDLSYALAGYLTPEPYVLYFATNTTNETTIQSGTVLASGTVANGDPGALTNVSVPLALAGQTGALVMRHVRTDSNGSLILWDSITLSATETTGVQTALNSGTPDSQNLKGSGVVYTKNAADGNVMADITNTNGVDYGCVSTSVSRATGSAVTYEVAGATNFVMGKSFTITPTTVQAGGNATVKFYFTEAEIAQWETETSNVRGDLIMIKNNGTSETATVTIGAFGSDVTLEATYTSGINGTYYFGKAQALTVAKNQFNVFAVYPNPSKGEVTLSLSTNEDVKVSLFDIRGRRVYAKLHNNNAAIFTNTLDFSAMAPGVYMLDVQSGSKRAVKKVVIQ